jgi:beta-mannanase
MNFSIPQDDWNYIAQYYPGSQYVDWLGLSIYGQQYPNQSWSAFTPLLQQPYRELASLDSLKPIMVAEWRCGEFPKSGNKAQFISEAFATMERKYPRLKAAVFWNDEWQNEDDSTSDLRANSSPESLDAYHSGAGKPFWLGQPMYAPARGN